MSKDKNIEVTLEDNQKDGSIAIVINEKTVGNISKLNSSKGGFDATIDGSSIGHANSMDEAIEIVIASYNLGLK